MTPERVVERAIAKVERSGECILSTYSLGGHGYPQIGWYDRDSGHTVMKLVHRVVWESVNGPIPDGMTIDHRRSICIGPPCVNVKHLRLLSNYENARRTRGRDWPVGQCINGHPNSELVRVGKAGKRVCRICRRKWQRDYHERQRGDE